MYLHPQVGQYRTDNRWLDVDGGAFTSADPVWPGTGNSQWLDGAGHAFREGGMPANHLYADLAELVRHVGSEPVDPPVGF
jgi:hypothetical protein